VNPIEPNIQIHTLEPSHLPVILQLNNAHAEETSLMTESTMTALLNIAFYARGIANGSAALLIALDQNAPYINPNFSWFQQRRESFVYIDRIIVAASHRGRGIARALYLDLFAAAKQSGHARVVCEVNTHPPNPASDAFHAAMGFLPIGEATIHNGQKTVRYFEKVLP
jgi:predicted GNAT superfamily acetyltransferase